MTEIDPAEKGKRYARIFRKAGVLLGKGEVERAIKVLGEGEALARTLGDRSMERRYADEIARITTARKS